MHSRETAHDDADDQAVSYSVTLAYTDTKSFGVFMDMAHGNGA